MNHAPAYNDLGILYQEQKRFDEAESQYCRAMEADPREPVYPRNLGDLSGELKRSEEAEQWYRKALEIDANHAPAYNDLGILYQEQKGSRGGRVAILQGHGG